MKRYKTVIVDGKTDEPVRSSPTIPPQAAAVTEPPVVDLLQSLIDAPIASSSQSSRKDLDDLNDIFFKATTLPTTPHLPSTDLSDLLQPTVALSKGFYIQFFFFWL